MFRIFDVVRVANTKGISDQFCMSVTPNILEKESY